MLSDNQRFLNTHFVFIMKCVFVLHSVFCELCDCISEAFVGIFPRYRQTYLSHHTVSLPLSPFPPLTPSALPLSLPHALEFSIKSEDKDGNSLAFQFLPGPKVTLLASKTSRESNNNRWDFHRTRWSLSMKWHRCSRQNMESGICETQLEKNLWFALLLLSEDLNVCLFVRALSDSKWQLWGHVAGGEGAGPEIRPIFLQTGSQRLQKKLQWATPTARVLPVCWQSLPGI